MKATRSRLLIPIASLCLAQDEFYDAFGSDNMSDLPSIDAINIDYSQIPEMIENSDIDYDIYTFGKKKKEAQQLASTVADMELALDKCGELSSLTERANCQFQIAAAFGDTMNAADIPIEPLFDDITGQEISQLKSADDNSRSLSSMIGDHFFDQMNGYGCWCYFDNDGHGKGKSNPKDDLDTFCKSLHEAYDCMILDHDSETKKGKHKRHDDEKEEEECSPWATKYSPAMLGETDTIINSCYKKNFKKGSCAVRACTVESQFVSSVFKYLIQGGKIQKSLKHSDKNFSLNEVCAVVPKGASEKECCGAYPFRRPFKTYGGERQCCGSRTFDPSVLRCCEGDRLRNQCN